nr:probable cytochrome P450 6a13 [Maniola hyperantus]
MKDSSTGYELKLTDEILAAQAFIFLLGGVNNLSVVTHFTFLELASNKNILEKLHEEIDSVFRKCNEKITFDDIEKFVYLDMILCEVLRKYPPIPSIGRNCTADTTLPSTQKRVSKDTKIIIPIYALQRDKTYFPEPDKFDPERFNNENKPKIVKYSYMPFGQGNRKCIGMKFARLLLKFSLAWILRSFTLKEQKYDPKNFDPSLVVLKDVSARFELIPRK